VGPEAEESSDKWIYLFDEADHRTVDENSIPKVAAVK
jgi:hypothetical protein